MARGLPSNCLATGDWTCLVGAITEDGDSFFSRFNEYITGEHAKQFIPALWEGFVNNLIVMLNGAPYFWVSLVTDLADRDGPAIVRSLGLNLVEEYWRQLLETLSNHLFNSLENLNIAIDTSLNRIFVPNMSNYF